MITCDYGSWSLDLSQERYIEKILSRFSIQNAKARSMAMGTCFKVSKEHSPKMEGEWEYMKRVPYASIVWSLMYAMICTRLDIVYVVRALSWFMVDLGKKH